MMKTTDGRFQVMNVDFENAGGHCMVLVATVYDSLVNNVRYVLYSDDAAELSTVDYVFSDIDFDDRMLIASYNEEEHEAYINCSGQSDDGELKELFEYCWQEFIKRSCKYFKRTVCYNYEILPLALINQMPAGYGEWLNENGLLIETDGESICVDDRFISSVEESNKKTQAQEDLESLQDYLADWLSIKDDSDETLNEFYNQKITLGFGNRMVVLDNSAAVYSSLEMCIREILSEDYDVE